MTTVIVDSHERTVLRRLGLLLPGARQRRRQIDSYATSWRSHDEGDGGSEHPWWMVLGDSTAQGIGASSYDRGYVGLVRDWLTARDGRPWHVRNVSVSGARAADVVATQVPQLVEARRLPSPPALVSCAIGANDLLRRSDGLLDAIEAIAGVLPPGALFANLPRGLRERDAAAMNGSIATLAATHGLRLVDLWSVSGPPWRGKFARDLFHPSDLGYQDWARAFIAAIEADGAVELRAMRVEDIPAVQDVEVRAGERFRSSPEPAVAACADHPPMPTGALDACIEHGLAWVVTVDGVVVGFLVGEALADGLHVEEVAVAPDHGGRGHATALLERASARAVELRLPAVTLTTFRDVPWNRPFYERRRFRVLDDAAMGDALRERMVDEDERYGLPRELRVAMRRDVSRRRAG